MAFDLRVIPIREFMKTDITGVVDVNASRDMLSEFKRPPISRRHARESGGRVESPEGRFRSGRISGTLRHKQGLPAQSLPGIRGRLYLVDL